MPNRNAKARKQERRKKHKAIKVYKRQLKNKRKQEKDEISI